MSKQNSLLIFTLLFLVTSFLSCSNQNGNGKDYNSDKETISFKAPSLTEEKEYKFEDFKGEPVILNFWASWCVPCRDEMPFLEKTWDELKDKGINVIGVNVMDNKKEALEVLEYYKITYLNLFDPSGDVSRKFGVLGLPATIFIDKNGNVAKQNYGPFIGEQGEKSFKDFLGEIL